MTLPQVIHRMAYEPEELDSRSFASLLSPRALTARLDSVVSVVERCPGTAHLVSVCGVVAQ